MAIQSLVVFVSTLAALSAFRMEGASLLIGALCGQFAAFVHLASLRWDINTFCHFRHVTGLPARCDQRAPTTVASGLVDGTRGFGENALLTSTIGLHAVGILSRTRASIDLELLDGSG